MYMRFVLLDVFMRKLIETYIIIIITVTNLIMYLDLVTPVVCSHR
jgi:hypothetical protein